MEDHQSPGIGAGKPVVIVCDDHIAIRAGIARILEDRGVAVAGECYTIGALLNLVQKFPSAVVLTDLAVQELPFPDLMRQIRATSLDAKVVVYSMRESAATIHLCYESGATAFVPKRSEPDEIIRAIESAHQGVKYLPPDVAANLAKLTIDPTAPQNILNQREREIFVSFVRGESLEDMAARLEVTERTLNNTLSQISKKLDAPRTAFFQIAKRYGLIE